ncbi:response regulator [Ginsengibacter hankyongi]|uniref:Response regulator n=1 Tax=Ginsengibacter hankyongi TaxID=2607284 RepID=A0A5J5IHG3_9BACT|nr:response regulator [Ginsengibacter hankyongi]KAA9040495.1 response regulator [Ginsengibacter hankyongi]
MKKRLLIIDTSTAVIQRLKELVSESLNIEDIELSASFSAASKNIKNNLPDIVLLDLTLPVNESIEFLKKIKKENPGMSVIVLSDAVDERTEEQCKLAGADYFFDRYNEFEKIPGAIEEIRAWK